jgi:hypothetical protein
MAGRGLLLKLLLPAVVIAISSGYDLFAVLNQTSVSGQVATHNHVPLPGPRRYPPGYFP